MPYLSALEVCSRQGVIQIHVYLYLYLYLYHQLTALPKISAGFEGPLRGGGIEREKGEKGKRQEGKGREGPPFRSKFLVAALCPFTGVWRLRALDTIERCSHSARTCLWRHDDVVSDVGCAWVHVLPVGCVIRHDSLEGALLNNTSSYSQCFSYVPV